jgi:tetratricopeptide (TPR) repeat protein
MMESVFKGIFLGLLFFVAIEEPDWTHVGLTALLGLVGLALFLGVAAYQKKREGYEVKGRFFPFLLFLCLECPQLVYAGILAGFAAAAFLVRSAQSDYWILLATVVGGAVLGIVFRLLRSVEHRWTRLGVSFLLGVILVAGALLGFGLLGNFGEQLGTSSPVKDPTLFGTTLLIGIPFFYLLSFAGREEETEVEVAALCSILALGAGMLAPPRSGVQTAAFTASALIYLWYTTQVLNKLRTFKHAVRGFSYARLGRNREAILSFRRALQLDSSSTLAREGLWGVHRALNLNQLADDRQTLEVLDFDLCLERVGSLLLQAKPSAEKLHEALRLLDLVLSQRPTLKPVVHYWRSVAHTHAARYEEAAAELQQVLDPDGYASDDPHRRSILLQAWLLAMRLHPELTRRVGTPQLALPGRRMEAIAAVEGHLSNNPEDQDTWALKRVLYQDLTEADYDSASASRGASARLLGSPEGDKGSALGFDHDYTQQLGLALINDPARWQRGAEYLRIAVRGLPAHGPSIFTQVAQAQQRQGDGEGAWKSYERARQAGRSVGPKNLPDEERQAYFSAVKLLADSALAHDRIDLAIENYQLYTEFERSGLETLRTLAELYERRGDPLSALRVTEQALLYNAKDKDLLERKDRYYYSVLPDDLRARLDMIRGGFDVSYCLKKARAVLDAKNWDLDLLDWAQHLAELVRVVQPESLAAKVLVARARLRRGEKEEAMTLLEGVRTGKPEKFANGEDEEGWYLASRLLGDIYLNELNKPELAVECFKDFRKSSKSGADTLYKLGQAYEQLGDPTRAVKYYKHVVSYDAHPLAPDARDALQRLQAT